MENRRTCNIMLVIALIMMLSIPCNAQDFFHSNNISIGLMPNEGFVVSRAYYGGNSKDLRRCVFNTEVSARKHLSDRFLIEENFGINSISSRIKSSKYNNLNYKFVHKDNSFELTTKFGYNVLMSRLVNVAILAGIKTRFAIPLFIVRPSGYYYTISISDQEYYNVQNMHFKSVFTYFVYALRLSKLITENITLSFQFSEDYKIMYNSLDETIAVEHWKNNQLIENYDFDPIKKKYFGIGISYVF